jgi:hypothetical protein
MHTQHAQHTDTSVVVVVSVCGHSRITAKLKKWRSTEHKASRQYNDDIDQSIHLKELVNSYYCCKPSVC